MAVAMAAMCACAPPLASAQPAPPPPADYGVVTQVTLEGYRTSTWASAQETQFKTCIANHLNPVVVIDPNAIDVLAVANTGSASILVDYKVATTDLNEANTDCEIEEVVADKGYHSEESLDNLQNDLGRRTYIPEPQRDTDKPFLMPIEDVFSIQGRGTVVTGRVERGIIHVNDEIEIIGIRSTKKSICTGVEMFRKLLDEGRAGDNVGVLLRGTKREEVERGQVLAAPGTITPHTQFEAEV